MCTHACTLSHTSTYIHLDTLTHTNTHVHTRTHIHTHNLRCRSGQVKLKPVVVDDYNQHMLGVNKLDQFASYYSFLHKSVRWWRKVFSGCFRSPSSMPTSSTRSWQRHKDGDQWPTKLFEYSLTTCQSHSEAKHPSKLDDGNQPLRTLNIYSRYLTSQQRGESADCCVCSDRRPGGKRHSDTTTVPHAAPSLLCVWPHALRRTIHRETFTISYLSM